MTSVSSMFTRLLAFVQLTRPLFLIGAVLVYGLGAAIAHAGGVPIDWERYVFGQALVTSIQLTTQYANEYFDVDVDRAVGANRTWFSGGSGVLAEGRLSPMVALNAARVMAAMSISLILIAAAIEPAASGIGALALLGGWFYSAPPIRIAASVWSAATTALIVAFLAPLTAMVLQHHTFDPQLLAVSAALIPINVAMILLFEFSDFDADRQAGKWTLTARVGRERASRVHNGLLVAAFTGVWVAAAAGWIDPRIAAWTLLALPLAAWQIGGVVWRARRGWNGMGLMQAGGIGLFALTTTAFLAGYLTR